MVIEFKIWRRTKIFLSVFFRIIDEVKRAERAWDMYNRWVKIVNMDNRELLHRLIAIRQAHCRNLNTQEDEIWAEMESRLYPEYDGVNVQWEEWGWKIKDKKDIIYPTFPAEN